MANNTYVNKVQYGSSTLIDLTGDTVTAASLAQGYTAHDASGAPITGTMSGGTEDGHVYQDAQGYVVLDDETGKSYQSKSVSYTPSESQQTASVTADNGYDALSAVNVTVDAVSSTYVGSGVARRSSTDLTASGATVTAPAGYYASSASKSVASGSATAPATISGTSASVSTGTNTLTLSKTVSVTPSVTAGYISSGTAGNSSVSLTASVNTRSSSDLTASGATVTAPAGYYADAATKSVSSMTLPTSASGTSSGTSKATIGRSTSDQYINIPTGYNSSAAYYKVSAVADGTAGTPTATKGAVSNHSISVTPSVTNTTGYISGSTKTGTAVTVTASELASGNLAITENTASTSCVGYSTVSVDVPTGGGSSYTPIYSTSFTVSTTSTTAITVGTVTTGDSSIWTSGKLVYVKIRDTAGWRANHYYGCDAFLANNIPATTLTSTSTYAWFGEGYSMNASFKLSTNPILSRSSSSAPSGYGVYPTYLDSSGNITINARYSNSSSSSVTQAIDGTFSVDVYLLDWPDGVSVFSE